MNKIWDNVKGYFVTAALCIAFWFNVDPWVTLAAIIAWLTIGLYVFAIGAQITALTILDENQLLFGKKSFEPITKAYPMGVLKRAFGLLTTAILVELVYLAGYTNTAVALGITYILCVMILAPMLVVKLNEVHNAENNNE